MACGIAVWMALFQLASRPGEVIAQIIAAAGLAALLLAYARLVKSPILRFAGITMAGYFLFNSLYLVVVLFFLPGFW
jgi:hypothetical protein